jgi:hypothetical protein
MKTNFLKKKKVDRRLEIYDFTLKVVRWLCLSLVKAEDKPSIPLTLLEDLCHRLSRIIKGRGVKEAIRYVKATRGNFYNYLSNNPLRIPDSPCYGETQFPSILGPLKQYVDNEHYDVIRLILTVLTASRALKLKSDVDTSSITQPVKGDVPDLTKHMRAFWEELGYSVKTKDLPRKLSSVQWMIYRLSRGPNGHALLASNYEADLIPSTLLSALDIIASGIKGRIEGVIAGKLLEFQIYWGKPVEKPRGLIRKITSFPDKEGKMRTIGILDYWSQMALKPLHSYLARILEKIPQDCTLDQSKFRSLVKGSDIYYSVDLSSATDRFPISLIKQLLEIRLPASYVDAWAEVMVGQPFDFQGDRLIYQAGTPMGSYSSFNSFAFTHHFIIYHCCRELGLSWKRLPYALLGDDIIIGNKGVAEMYMKVIASIHVDISLAKTHKSDKFYEFAKRIIYNDIEVSPFPISALRQASKSSDTLVVLLREVRKRGYDLISISSSIQLYFSVVKEFRAKLCKKIAVNSNYFDIVLDLIQGIVPAYECFNSILGKNNLPNNFFKEWMQLDSVVSLSYLKLLQNNITLALTQIKNFAPSSVMKSNDLMKSYYAFCDEQEINIKGMASGKYRVIHTPIYGAIYALEKELKDERTMITEAIDNNTISINKKTSKSKLNKSKISDLLVYEHDKKKIVNTTREFFLILEENIKREYWMLYSNMGFNSSIQMFASRKTIKDTVKSR